MDSFRMATIRKPALSISVRMALACPSATASGLMMLNVRSGIVRVAPSRRNLSVFHCNGRLLGRCRRALNGPFHTANQVFEDDPLLLYIVRERGTLSPESVIRRPFLAQTSDLNSATTIRVAKNVPG